MNTLKKYGALGIFGAVLASCSVGMALDGNPPCNTSVIKRGAHKTDVEMQLKNPVSIDRKPDGTIYAIYHYEVGTEPSTGRAVAHGVMDVLTLGIWEVVGTPVESFKGDKMAVGVTYDSQEYVQSAAHLGKL